MRLNEIVMNNAWRMRYCKSERAEKQEVNSALPYESRLSDNTLLLISHSISLRESLPLMCGFQKDCLRSRWNLNSETVIQSVRNVKKAAENVSEQLRVRITRHWRSSGLSSRRSTRRSNLTVIVRARCVPFALRRKDQRRPWRRGAPVWMLRSTPSPASWQTWRAARPTSRGAHRYDPSTPVYKYTLTASGAVTKHFYSSAVFE